MTKKNIHQLIEFCELPEVTNKLIASEDRIRRAYNELFSGYGKKGSEILNDVIHVTEYTGTIKMANIHFYSMCEHHFAPFFGTCSIEYQPNKIITGLGKLVRLVKDVHSKRLQIQELMTKDICVDIMENLEAKGCYVEMRAVHLCVCSRGPKDDKAETISTYGMGSLKHKVLEK